MDHTGRIIGEKIVTEDKISSENVVKNSNENLLAKVLAANLQKIKSLSTNALRLHNLGRKVGNLNANDKAKFKSDLSSLGEAASNTIKLIEEIGDNVDMLFKINATSKSNFEEDVGEEGVGIDAPVDDGPQNILEGATIADARPIGLAVIGENGLAAARPMATAVATTGIAVARPIATAIAGIDPSVLGLHLQFGHHQKKN